MKKEKPTTDYLLHIDKIKTVLKTRQGDLVPVEDVDVRIPARTTVGLVGESGCGKSMTAMSVMDLLPKNGKVAQGRILFKGEDLLEKSDEERRDITGNQSSSIFQEPLTSLNPLLVVS